MQAINEPTTIQLISAEAPSQDPPALDWVEWCRCLLGLENEPHIFLTERDHPLSSSESLQLQELERELHHAAPQEIEQDRGE